MFAAVVLVTLYHFCYKGKIIAKGEGMTGTAEGLLGFQCEDPEVSKDK